MVPFLEYSEFQIVVHICNGVVVRVCTGLNAGVLGSNPSGDTFFILV